MTATTVRLNKGEAPSWGFRLQGGKDFGTPLVIQKVNGGSPAERAGLIAGDAVIRINNVDVYNLLHKEAQDVIVRAGNSFEMAIQRGGSTWKPSVVPIGAQTKPSPSINNVSTVTKTSLAAVPGENIGAIGTGHNLSAKPFASQGPQVNGAVNGSGPKLVNKQYNTPVKLYSEDAIAETISAQSEVLSTGALGVNFKKNEKNYDSSNSAVYRMLKEAENEPNTPEQEPDSGIVTAPNRGMAGLKHVEAPQNKPMPSNPQLPPGQNICVECERLIVGVFVRIKDKNLHVECFKCSTCGSSLKNVGYYNINNKLYCDVHAKSAAIAINNPTAVPITISPVGKTPARAISAALSNQTLPSPAPLSPKIPSYPSSNIGGPKAFSSVSAPLSPGGTLNRAPLSPPQNNFTKAPLSPSVHSYGSYSPAGSTGGRSTNIIWPPPQDSDLPTACPLFYPPPSRIEAEIEKKQIEKERTNFEREYFSEEEDDTMFYSEECDRRSASECLIEQLDTQKLVEDVVKSETKIENVVPQKWESPLTQAARTTEPDSDTFCLNPHRRVASPMVSALAIAPKEPFTPRTASSLDFVPLPEMTEPYFPPEHPIIPVKREECEEAKKEEKLPIPKPYSPFVKALEIAPERPFTPTGVSPVPQVKKKPKDPLDQLLDELPKPSEKLDMRSALMTAPDRPYTPLISEFSSSISEETHNMHEVKKFEVHVKPEELPASFQMNKQEPKPPSYYAPSVIEERIRSTESFEATQNTIVEKQETVVQNQEAITTIVNNFAPKQETVKAVVQDQEAITATVNNFAPIFQGFSCSFKNKTDHSQFSVEVNTTPPVPTPPPKPQTPISYIATVEERPACVRMIQEQQQKTKNVEVKESKTIQKQAEEVVQVKTHKPAGLRKPETLPSYQKDLQATAEADLILMERKRRAEERIELQKKEREQQAEEQRITKPEREQLTEVKKEQTITKPIIKIEPSNNFQPILDDKPCSKTFSPRPRSITPSMINKAPALLPYYQDNLVPHFHAAIATNLFDPTHPEVSRSPSPHPGMTRSPSPLPEIPNPLKSKQPLPTPQDSKIELAKESLKTYIPEYKSQRDVVEQQKGLDFCRRDSYSQNVAYPSDQFTVQSGTVQQQICDIQRNQTQIDGAMRKDIQEQNHQQHLEASRQSQSQSVEMQSGGVQIQRRKIVSEEFERSHKEQNIQIQTRAFERANLSGVETFSPQSFHITDPHHAPIPSLKAVEQRQKQPQTTPIPTPIAPIPPPVPPIRTSIPPNTLNKYSVNAPSCRNPSDNVNPVPNPDTGAGAGRQTGGVTAAPKRGRGLLNTAALPGGRAALCGQCHGQIRGPFITALGKIWCPQHFVCATPSCKRPLQDLGFVEERGQLYCEYCFEQYLAPSCSKCNGKIKGDCLKAIGKNFHPECFNCVYCGKLFGNNPFFLEDGNPYCDADWNELFTTKCFACGFPVEAGDRWVEALNNNYHSQCFNCTMCKKNLEGQSFFAKGGRPFCKNHAR